MGCLISFALLALLFVTTFGRSFSCEIKNNTNYCSGEAEKWTGKNSDSEMGCEVGD